MLLKGGYGRGTSLLAGSGWVLRGRRTVLDIAVLYLLQHLGPHGGVALLVRVDALCAQVQPLADAAGALVCGSH